MNQLEVSSIRHVRQSGPVRSARYSPLLPRASVRQLLVFWSWLAAASASAQVPVPPATPKSSHATDTARTPAAITDPTHDNPEATAAEATGPISIAETVSDDSVRRKLEKLLPRYPGVRSIEIEVDEGVVTLTGHVADADVRDRVRDFVRRVQGVNLVLNRTRTDAQVLSAQEFAVKHLQAYWEVISRKWLLFLFSIVLVLASFSLARLFKRSGERLLTPFTGNQLLRSVLGSVIAVGIVIGGILSALQLLGMTEAVLSFLGLAGVVALAVGFAFRDIAENFIASIMLGVRRPFRVGDFIEVAGRSGVVRSLNTRATVLVTLDGSQVRIPNATIFKEVVVNRTASSSVRGSFDVIIPWNASVATATSAITEALREHEGFDKEPSPRTLVEALEPTGIRLRATFWSPGQGVDRLKLMSDSQLAAKVALQKAGINPGPTPTIIQVPREGARERPRSADGRHDGEGSASLTRDQAGANLARDTHAANVASAQLPADQSNEMRHAMDVADKGISEEGTNLLKDKEPNE